MISFFIFIGLLAFFVYLSFYYEFYLIYHQYIVKKTTREQHPNISHWRRKEDTIRIKQPDGIEMEVTYLKYSSKFIYYEIRGYTTTKTAISKVPHFYVKENVSLSARKELMDIKTQEELDQYLLEDTIDYNPNKILN